MGYQSFDHCYYDPLYLNNQLSGVKTRKLTVCQCAERFCSNIELQNSTESSIFCGNKMCLLPHLLLYFHSQNNTNTISNDQKNLVSRIFPSSSSSTLTMQQSDSEGNQSQDEDITKQQLSQSEKSSLSQLAQLTPPRSKTNRLKNSSQKLDMSMIEKLMGAWND
jgi:hypothetical protein